MQETASLSRIRPGKNPREFFDEDEMNELAESIRSYGVLQPILVRPASEAGEYVIIAGEPPATQDIVLKGILDHNVAVPVLKAQLGKFARKLADAIFDTHQCSGCPHNSAMQAGLFGESLGEGYCQHPSHFDELTTQVIEAKAARLKDEYQVVKIVRKEDA